MGCQAVVGGYHTLLSLVAVMVVLTADQGWAEKLGGRGGAGAAEDGDAGSDGCRFPQQWRGAYFLGGSREKFIVTGQIFGVAGFCYRHHGGNKYTVYNRHNKCFQCIQVVSKKNLPKHNASILGMGAT